MPEGRTGDGSGPQKILYFYSMNFYQRNWLLWLLFCSMAGRSQTAFTVVPLGVRGGLDESNLSSYMVAAGGTQEYICLDAGTLYAGIRKAVDKGSLPPPAGEVLRNSIKAYFISHPHLDHVAGLIINSPDDSAKPIYGLPACLKVLQDKYFTWEGWANFGDEGEKPLLKKYHYITMEPGQEMIVAHTGLSVKAFPLSHGAPYESTAFLVRSGGAWLLYLGDTGADSLEHSDKLHLLWEAVGPLVRAGQLKAVFIEVSFPNAQPDKSLFGHLTPRLLMQEMKDLGGVAGGAALKGLAVVITHRKPSGAGLRPGQADQEEVIRRELEAVNPLGLKLVFPEQGVRMRF
jgi:cAMP phosphodiesterase